MAIYGNTITYDYEEELEDGTTEKKKLTLVFNPLTLIKYYNYVGREFMTDFYDIAFKSQKNSANLSKELREKMEAGEEVNYEDISESDLKALSSADYSANLEFFINLIAAMIATREHPKQPDFAEIIGSIPLFVLYDTEFLTELLSFISFGLKKNKGILGKLGRRQAKRD